MKNACLKVGQHLTLGYEQYEILRINEEGIYQLERQKDFLLVNKPKVELLIAIEAGDLKFTHHGNKVEVARPPKLEQRDLSSFHSWQQDVAKRRMDYIRTAIERLGDTPRQRGLDRVITLVSRELRDENAPSPISLYRWWTRWLDSGRDITSLAPKKRKTGYLTTNFSKRAIKMLSDIIYEDFLTREKFTKADVYEKLLFQVNQHNKTTSMQIKTPSRSTVFRFLKNLDSYEVLLAKKGKRQAKKQFRVSGRGVMPTNILERVEVDHTPLDLIVIDDQTFLPVGRPNLTSLVDKASRQILGYSVSFEPPSELSVIRAMRHAFFPKASNRERYPDIAGDWLAYGVPMTLVVDNGLEFHSKMLRQLCYELNIELVFCPKQEPQFKGCVER